jgi:hypothetical protein
MLLGAGKLAVNFKGSPGVAILIWVRKGAACAITERPPSPSGAANLKQIFPGSVANRQSGFKGHRTVAGIST